MVKARLGSDHSTQGSIMNIKPGDLFEWVYKRNNSSVREGEELYSITIHDWIPCDGLCLCIGTQDEVIHWISDKGLFHGRPHNDTYRAARAINGRRVAIIPQRIQ